MKFVATEKIVSSHFEKKNWFGFYSWFAGFVFDKKLIYIQKTQNIKFWKLCYLHIITLATKRSRVIRGSILSIYIYIYITICFMWNIKMPNSRNHEMACNCTKCCLKMHITIHIPWFWAIGIQTGECYI